MDPVPKADDQCLIFHFFFVVDTLIQKRLFEIMKKYIFWGDLTDISVTKETTADNLVSKYAVVLDLASKH